MVGYNPGLGGAMPFPVQPDNTIPKWPRGSWETSGIIDASALYGAGTWLLDVQAHTVDSLLASQLQGFTTDQKVVEGGQLLLMTVAPREPGTAGQSVHRQKRRPDGGYRRFPADLHDHRAQRRPRHRNRRHRDRHLAV